MTGDSDRLDEALRGSVDDLLAYAERRVGIDDAPDVLGEAMSVAWRRVGDLPRDPVEARMWLFGVTRNVVANAQRGRVRRSRLAERLRAVTSRGAAPAADDGVEVREAIAALDPVLAEIVRLRHWEGFTLAEIAQLLDEPASTVRSRYARARDQLTAALAHVDALGTASRG